MDNKLNEIRSKIRFLRTEMLTAEGHIRKQVNRDEDCSEAAVHLMSMRVTTAWPDQRAEPARRRRAAA